MGHFHLESSDYFKTTDFISPLQPTIPPFSPGSKNGTTIGLITLVRKLRLDWHSFHSLTISSWSAGLIEAASVRFLYSFPARPLPLYGSGPHLFYFSFYF